MLSFQIFISQLAGQTVMVITLLLIACVLLIKGYKQDFYIIGATTLLAMFTSSLLKLTLHIPRPEHMLIEEDGYRFPSGHATMASVVMCLGMYYAHEHIKNVYLRNITCISLVAWYILVSYSRLYLHVHYPIDVIVGGLIGIITAILVIRQSKHHF